MHHYFCNSCGHHFASDIPERNEIGTLNDIPCPECGSWDIFPDTSSGSAAAIKEFNEYENEIEFGD